MTSCRRDMSSDFHGGTFLRYVNNFAYNKNFGREQRLCSYLRLTSCRLAIAIQRKLFVAKFVLILGVLFGTTAVAAGAMEHAVRGMIIADVAGSDVESGGGELSDPAPNPEVAKRLAQYETGVRYHMYHGLALIGLGVVMAISSRGQLLGILAALSMVIGLKLFSGTLYLISALGMTHLTMLVPIGGSFMILGWILFLITVLLFEPLVDREDLE